MGHDSVYLNKYMSSMSVKRKRKETSEKKTMVRDGMGECLIDGGYHYPQYQSVLVGMGLVGRSSR